MSILRNKKNGIKLWKAEAGDNKIKRRNQQKKSAR